MNVCSCSYLYAKDYTERKNIYVDLSSRNCKAKQLAEDRK